MHYIYFTVNLNSPVSFSFRHTHTHSLTYRSVMPLQRSVVREVLLSKGPAGWVFIGLICAYLGAVNNA